MAVRIYEEVKIDNRGRVLLPKKMRDYFMNRDIKKVWFEQDTEENITLLCWTNRK